VSVLYSESSIGDYAQGSLDIECVSFRSLSLFVNNMRPAKLILPHSKKFSSGTGGGRKPRAIRLIHVHLENGLKNEGVGGDGVLVLHDWTRVN